MLQYNPQYQPFFSSYASQLACGHIQNEMNLILSYGLELRLSTFPILQVTKSWKRNLGSRLAVVHVHIKVYLLNAHYERYMILIH